MDETVDCCQQGRNFIKRAKEGKRGEDGERTNAIVQGARSCPSGSYRANTNEQTRTDAASTEADDMGFACGCPWHCFGDHVLTFALGLISGLGLATAIGIW